MPVCEICKIKSGGHRTGKGKRAPEEDDACKWRGGARGGGWGKEESGASRRKRVGGGALAVFTFSGSYYGPCVRYGCIGFV